MHSPEFERYSHVGGAHGDAVENPMAAEVRSALDAEEAEGD